MEEENTRVAVLHGVGEGGQEGQQGPAVERDGDDRPSEPGTHEQRGKALYQRRIHGTWRSEVVKRIQQLG